MAFLLMHGLVDNKSSSLNFLFPAIETELDVKLIEDETIPTNPSSPSHQESNKMMMSMEKGNERMGGASHQ